mmetsp:Transcript_24587/g.34354  ORF Transcript_24587/g.34354 Transcript_24587/m.34354 type:complete len:111 (-) Transcript_24587:41-373(-)
MVSLLLLLLQSFSTSGHICSDLTMKLSVTIFQRWCSHAASYQPSGMEMEKPRNDPARTPCTRNYVVHSTPRPCTSEPDCAVRNYRGKHKNVIHASMGGTEMCTEIKIHAP